MGASCLLPHSPALEGVESCDDFSIEDAHMDSKRSSLVSCSMRSTVGSDGSLSRSDSDLGGPGTEWDAAASTTTSPAVAGTLASDHPLRAQWSFSDPLSRSSLFPPPPACLPSLFLPSPKFADPAGICCGTPSYSGPHGGLSARLPAALPAAPGPASRSTCAVSPRLCHPTGSGLACLLAACAALEPGSSGAAGSAWGWGSSATPPAPTLGFGSGAEAVFGEAGSHGDETLLGVAFPSAAATPGSSPTPKARAASAGSRAPAPAAQQAPPSPPRSESRAGGGKRSRDGSGAGAGPGPSSSQVGGARSVVSSGSRSSERPSAGRPPSRPDRSSRGGDHPTAPPPPSPQSRGIICGPCTNPACEHPDRSPQWRKGPPEHPVLCNACGTRWLRNGSLIPLVPRRGLRYKTPSDSRRPAGGRRARAEPAPPQSPAASHVSLSVDDAALTTLRAPLASGPNAPAPVAAAAALPPTFGLPGRQASPCSPCTAQPPQAARTAPVPRRPPPGPPSPTRAPPTPAPLEHHPSPSSWAADNLAAAASGRAW